MAVGGGKGEAIHGVARILKGLVYGTNITRQDSGIGVLRWTGWRWGKRKYWLVSWRVAPAMEGRGWQYENQEGAIKYKYRAVG